MRTMWGLHHGRSEVRPGSDNFVRVGWDNLTDLNQLEDTRDAFKEAVMAAYPDKKMKSALSSAGTLYRFAHMVKVNDIVVCPDKEKRTIQIGRITGPYEHHPDRDLYQHARPVEWLRLGIPRDELSLPAKNELGSAITLFEINTGREEIEALLAENAPADEGADFSWVPFYEELFNRILQFRGNRQELIDKVFQISERSGLPRLFKYLEYDRAESGPYMRLTDIDPFTALTPFNRKIKPKSRMQIAAAYKDEFNLTTPVPTGFAGVPIVNHNNSWFIRPQKDRKPNDVNNLWDLAEAARTYAADPSEEAKEALVSSFDACAKGLTRQLSMGLFWMRPRTFAAYDSNNTTHIRQAFPELADSLVLKNKLTGEEFLSNTEILNTWIGSSGAPSTIPDLSFDAYTKKTAVLEPVVDTPVQGEEEDAYSVDAIVDDGSFLDTAELERISATLARKKNLILQGPPGTGKTWLARRLGWVICGKKTNEQVTVVQFHPSLSHEDFVRGFRPSSSGKLDLQNGPFIEFCERAAADPENEYVLVLEEINRGNPAQIFGEMLTLIEGNKRNRDNALRLAYPLDEKETFFVPPNVHLIGTMNVADRSLALVDMALRRRFAFIDLEPQLGNAWLEHVSELGYDRDILELTASRVSKVNELISDDSSLGRHYCMGHSFFVPSNELSADDNPVAATEQWLREVISTEIAPLLKEYWFDQPEKVEEAFQTLGWVP